MVGTKSQKIPRVPETIVFPKEEEKILAYWKQIDAFKTCLKQSKGKPKYTFYDGPPFATGLPHYGHILAGTIKDVVTRYAHQLGYHVERRFGWDCHGLPVEHEIDKTLNIKGPDDVMRMGIAKYNAECRKIVMRYSDEWEKIVGRLGRWIDFKNDYKTLYPWFMESVWWIFKQLYVKGLVYKGNKVMPYSTACNTPLSNFETGQNYKDVVDPAVTVSLPIVGDKEGASILVWTTTPWTLPSNLATCVHPDLIYARIQQISTGKVYILMECRIESIFPLDDIKVLKTFPGKELKDLRYEPAFGYFSHLKSTAFRILVDEYVTSESGTGIVHQAPYFGEDDNRVCLANGVVTRDQEPICPIDAKGCFVEPVTDFLGQYVKDADKNIIAYLKEKGRLVHQSQIKHSYPFCWRSDTPLIYRSVPSWFVRVEHMRDDLLESIAETFWVPDFVKEKRFANWLKEARDWAVSRNRYWGTPIPIWTSPDGDEIVCIGSIAELEELSGQKVTDLHREVVDAITIPSRIPGNPPLRRISEVFDCWFESGSMPYAQVHYPFENSKEFEDGFPANFIAEGVDQTRGWFYTLTVLSTALFGKAPFKNLICNGLVLASDGFKMSKRKKNYPDPLEIVDKFGADALRLYLINSPVVKAENLRFKEEGVRDIIKDVFLPWYNAFRFLFQNLEIYTQNNDVAVFTYDEKNVHSDNIMDKWILSFTESLLLYIRKEMELYHLYNVIPRLSKYFDYLTNWYVRMNRKRLKGETGRTDCYSALMTLFNVILNIIKMMAPFSPFISETMYQYTKELLDQKADSVHYLMLPQPNEKLINLDIERAVGRMQSVIELGRVVRDRKTIPIKYPLPELIVVHRDPQYLDDIHLLSNYILSELNVKKISTTEDKSKFGITLRAEPDHKVLGARLKQEFKAVTEGLKSMTDEEINRMIQNGSATVAGQLIDISEVRLIFKSENLNNDQYEVNSDNDVLVLMDVTPDSSMQDEGTAREIINRVQKLRKKAHLVPTDEISVFYTATSDLKRVAEEYVEFIENVLKTPFSKLSQIRPADQVIIEDKQKVKGFDLHVLLTKKNASDFDPPSVNWINLELVDLKSKYCQGATKGMVLTQTGKTKITLENLKNETSRLFGIDKFELLLKDAVPVKEAQLKELTNQTVFVVPMGKRPKLPDSSSIPFCKFKNFAENGCKGTIIQENPVGNPTKYVYETILKQWKST